MNQDNKVNSECEYGQIESNELIIFPQFNPMIVPSRIHLQEISMLLQHVVAL